MTKSQDLTSADATELAQVLVEVVAAIDQARSLGLRVNVPEPLYRACSQVVIRYEAPGSPRDRSAQTGSSMTSPGPPPPGRGGLTGTGVAQVGDVPLRRLVWQVLNPGEEFTVADVVARLAEMGASWPANKVSNALGYWVSRQRLQRQRKGVYLYPTSAGPVVSRSEDYSGQEVPGRTWVKEAAKQHGQREQRKAM